MKMKTKRVLCVLLGLALLMVLLPVMSLTAQAATDTYTGLMNNGTPVNFNGYSWYIIADNSTAVDEGTLTLFSTSRIAKSKFDDSSRSYSSSYIKGYLDGLTASGSFAGVADAIVPTDLSDVGVTGAKLYLLSYNEANALSAGIRKGYVYTDQWAPDWWLRTPSVLSGGVSAVDYSEGAVDNYYGYPPKRVLAVRPALKLNLSKVTYDSETKTFTLKPVHTHSFSYSASGATITATCEAGCPDGYDTNGIVLTLSAGNATYNGSAYSGASLSDTTEWETAGLTVPTIEYAGRGSTTYAKSTTAPTDAGDYTASVTAGGVIATKDFTIAKADQTVTAPAAVSGLVYNGSAKTLVTAAEVTAGNTGGSVSYSLDNSNWSTSLPQGTNAGNYTVYYKVAGNDNYNEFVSSEPVSVTIAQADPTAPTGLTASVGQTLNDVTLPDGWTWADSSQSVGDAGDNTFKANFAGSGNYKSASDVDVTVTVSEVPVTGVTLDKTSLSIKEGETATLTATVAPSNATNKGVTWSVAPEGIIIVSDGVITVVAPGTATVTVTTNDGGKTATCTVTVLPEIKLTAGGGETHKIKKDGAMNFKFVYVGHDAKTYTAFEAAGKVVTVTGKNYSKQLAQNTDFTAKSGSLDLTLTKSYLDSLKPGDYTVTAKFKINGSEYESSAPFKVTASSGSGTTPGTGDDTKTNNIVSAMILFLLSLSFIAYMAYTDELFHARLLAVPAGITAYFSGSSKTAGNNDGFDDDLPAYDDGFDDDLDTDDAFDDDFDN